MPKHKKHGYIIGNISNLTQHELKTLNYFKGRGEKLELIPTSRTPGVKTIEHAFSAAKKQAKCIIFDLRSIKNIDEANKAITIVERLYFRSHKVKYLKIITKQIFSKNIVNNYRKFCKNK